MQQHGLSNPALARAVKVSHTSVGDWLNGAKPRPKVSLRIANYFGLPVDVLLDDAKELPAIDLESFPPAKRADTKKILSEFSPEERDFLISAGVAKGHYLDLESLFDSALKTRVPFSDPEEERDFKEMIRGFGRKRSKGRAAVMRAIDLMNSAAILSQASSRAAASQSEHVS